ncbi:triacylglycerol lipase [Pilibacter termitis]|uniref:Triacylglycerol lipase n=1 Tax=Pilibacter termitis TaxID=263852 RepID=A0A1T4M7H8_9ENTE|nr:alpha/beta hydrolase [Pilibacter termitis]SJZ62855.1 triacylglycerol lipase [Pilibacter termitis]
MKKKFLEKNFDVKVYNLEQKTPYVVLIHGIWGTHKDLSFVKERLLPKKFRIISIQYPSVEKIETIVQKYIAPTLEKLDSDVPIHFVVHSMGAVVLRYYLANFAEQTGKVIMIAPANQGSDLVSMVPKRPLSLILGEAMFQLKKNGAWMNELPYLKKDTFIFMGNRSNNFLYSLFIKGEDDGMIAVESAKMGGFPVEIIDGQTHTSILKNEEVLLEIEKLLMKNGVGE